MRTFTVSAEGKVEPGITIIKPGLFPRNYRHSLEIGEGEARRQIVLGIGEQSCDTARVTDRTIHIEKCDLFQRRDGKLLFVRERINTDENRILVRWQTCTDPFAQIRFETPSDNGAQPALLICGAKSQVDSLWYIECVVILYPDSSVIAQSTSFGITRARKLTRSLEGDFLTVSGETPVDTDGVYL